jgi:excisionase family DNA binding protein
MLTVTEVAARTGATDRTVRRWCESGKLSATRTLTGWTVMAGDLSAFLGRRDRPVSADGHSEDGHRPVGPDSPSDLSAIVSLVRELQQQVIVATSAAAMWQGRASVLQERVTALEAQVEQLRALPAPPPGVPEDTPQRESDARPPEPVQAPAGPRRRPWWAFWAA